MVKIEKNKLHQITVAELDKKIPGMNKCAEDKIVFISKWLINWIKTSLKNGKIKSNYIMPSKKELAYYLGVSVNTVQKVYEFVEYNGYLSAKKNFGTVIKDPSLKNSVNNSSILKRDAVLYEMKKYLSDANYKKGDVIPSMRTFAKMFDCSITIIQGLMTLLLSEDIIYREQNEIRYKMNKSNYEFNSNEVKYESFELKTYKNIEKYILNNLKVGDKTPSGHEFAKMYNVGLKTVNCAMQRLISQRILYSRRGSYGTVVINMPNSANLNHERKEDSIFTPVKDIMPYKYQMAYNYITKFIRENLEVGSILPTAKDLSKQLNISSVTVMHALKKLIEENYLCFTKYNRMSKLTVIDIPESAEDSFKWLSINPQFAKSMMVADN